MTLTTHQDSTKPTLLDDVVRICSNLIQIDTSIAIGNERPAAEYVMQEMAEVGLEPTVIEAEPGRTNLIYRIPGQDGSADAILFHAHLDVVPADPDEWTHHPLSGEIIDGMIWGRGAVDMKNMAAMMMSAAREMQRKNISPQRDLIFAFLADEEAGGGLGAETLVRDHPSLFEGATIAIGEVGGFSINLGDRRLYTLEVAQKGAFTLKLHVPGRSGHGSMLTNDNPIEKLNRILADISALKFDTTILDSNAVLFAQLEEFSEAEVDPDDLNNLKQLLGSSARVVGASVRNTANPTIIRGGHTQNVIPSSAQGVVDCRFVPGQRDHMIETITKILPEDVAVEIVDHGDGHEHVAPEWLETSLLNSLQRFDKDALLSPMCMSAATDARHFSKLGMTCVGFVPLQLPESFDFASMFHGVDERVPVDALQFGAKVILDLLETL